MNCGLCKLQIKEGDKPGVVANYDGDEVRVLCSSCLNFIIAFSLSSSFEEAEQVSKSEPFIYQALKAKLEVF